MISIRPLITNQFIQSFFKAFRDRFISSLAIRITINLMFHSFYSPQAMSKYLSIFRFLLFSFCRQQNPSDDKFCHSLSLFLLLLISSSCFLFFAWIGDFYMYLKIPDNMMRLILQDSFWFSYIPFNVLFYSFENFSHQH